MCLSDKNLYTVNYTSVRVFCSFVQVSVMVFFFSGDLLYFCFYALKPKGEIDTPEEFVMALNSSEVRGDKRCEVISALRVALTNNPVS